MTVPILRKCLAVLIAFSGSYLASATEQESDFILFKGEKCELETSWMFPSPLELYFRSRSKKSPFEPSSTANYRGHVATWEIAGNRLYLIDLEKRVSQEPESSAGKAPVLRGKPLIRSIFPEVIDKEEKVFARWFSGNVRIFGKPVKRTYKHQDDVEGHEMVENTEVTLLELKNGVVTRLTSFPRDEYWKKFGTYLDYRRLKADEVSAISEHVKFLDRQSEGWEDIGSIEPKGPFRTEKDFKFFLIRYRTEPVKIPLTKCEIVKDVTINFADGGWTIDDGLRISDGSHLLMLEMGSTNVPKGPWSSFTAGAVQVLVQLGRLESKEITFSEKDSGFVKVVNNYAKYESPQHVAGKLKVERNDDGKVMLSGFVRLTSEGPTTHQEIVLDNQVIPVSDVKVYVRRNNPPGKGPKGFYDPDSIIQRILKNSGK
ncbi:MAG: hypothetical protein WCF18_25890 [Chthoniobacteraceae bacterium]